MRLNYRYRVLACLAVLSIAVSSSACSGNLIPVTGNTAGNTLTLSACYQIRFLGLSKNSQTDTTTWRYQVEELPCAVQELSDWMLAIPACAVVVDASPASWEVIQPDPVLQSNGVKWKVPEEFQGGEFRVELSGGLMRGSMLVGVKAPNEAVGLIQGPVCDPNAPAPTVSLTATPTSTTTSTPLQPSIILGSPTPTLLPYFPPISTIAPTRVRPTRTPLAPLPTATVPASTPTTAPINTSIPNTPTSAPVLTSTPLPNPTNTSPPAEDTATSAPDPTKASKRPPTKTPKP
jgi:hypothetical protein